MRLTRRCRFVAIAFILLWQGTIAASTSNLKTSLESLDNWLGDGANGEAWRKYLGTPTILEALNSEQDPNRIDIARVLNRFESGAKGLDLGPFAKARYSIQQHAYEIKLTKLERELARMIEASAEAPAIPVEVRSKAKNEVYDALASLQVFISRGGYEVEQGWKSYLQWNDLYNELNSASPDVQVISQIATLYLKGHVGLERPSFVRVQEALLAYRLVLLEEADLQRLYYAQLNLLAGNLGEAAAEPNIATLTEINTRINWLDDIGQSSELLSGMRRQFNRPNVLIRVSESLISRGLADTVNQTIPISDTILGVQIRGNAATTAFVSADVSPSESNAAVTILLNGITHSRTVGNRPPVRIYSDSHTQVSGRKTVRVQDSGIVAEPASANCRTNTQIRSIESTRRFGARLIEKIAWKRAASQKSAGEQVASGRANERVANMMDEQTNERVATANEKMRSFRPRLASRNVYPEWIKFRSTDDEIHVMAKQGRTDQFGASSTPPQMPKFNLALQLHESMAANTTINYMAGLTLTDKMAAELAEDAMGEVPEELQLKDDEDPWSITFDRQNPVVLRFEGELVNIAIRGREFTRGEQSLKRLMEISANYKIFIVDGRLELARQGELEVSFPGRKDKRLAISEIPYRDLMKNKFSGLFKQHIQSSGLPIPDNFAKLGTLRLQYASSNGNWLSLGWN